MNEGAPFPSKSQVLLRERTIKYLRALTARRREVLDLRAAGSSSTEISHALGLSKKTIEAHLDQISQNHDAFNDPRGTMLRLIRTGVSIGVVAYTPSSEPVVPLLDIERKLADLVAEGKSNKELAVSLGVPEDVISKSIARIYQKLRVRNEYELAASLGYVDSLEK